MTIDLRSIATDLDAKDQILITYQELLAQGLPLDSIRQQMEREQVRLAFIGLLLPCHAHLPLSEY